MKGIEWVVLALVAIVALGIGAAVFSSNTVTEKVVVQDKVVYVNVPTADNTTLEIRNEIMKDKDFESVALALAQAELEDDDYEDLFEFLVDNGVSIVDEEDLGSVVVKDSDVSGIDAEDEDATVDYELKVYFEDADGDDKKVYVDVEFEVIDGEVEDVTYTLA